MPDAPTPQPDKSMVDLLAQGHALLAQQQYAEAFLCFEQATQLDPNSFDAWNNKGLALKRLWRPEEALAAYDQALAIDPNDTTAAWNNERLGA